MNEAVYPPSTDPQALALTVSYLPEDLGYATEALLRQKLLVGYCFMWGPALLLSFPAGAEMYDMGYLPHALFLPVVVGLGFVIQILLGHNSCMRIGRRAWQQRVFIKEPGQFILTAEYVEQRFPLVQGRYAWKCFKGAFETKRHIFLVFEGPSTMILPKRNFDSDAQMEMLRQIARRGIAADMPVRLWFETI